jgi:hypothetical protein
MNVMIQVDMMTREGVRRIELDEGDHGGVSRMIRAVKMMGMIKAVTLVGMM